MERLRQAAKNIAGQDKLLTNDPMEATYIGIHMWEAGREEGRYHRCGQGDRGDGGPDLPGAGGFMSTMDPKNHHLHKPVFIGEVKADGQFSVVWKTLVPVKAQPGAPSLPATTRRRTSRNK